ncbi:hypothetical protein [Micromonospora sp. NPDC047730]|uniref:hypothetical protein n=1 Tax=Micromonospora sp. NPDC047730 TaxID=3364253 RepID=UPI00371E3620
MSFMDWFVAIGITLTVVELAALAVMAGWWFGRTLSEVRQIDRKVAAERARLAAECRARERRS